MTALKAIETFSVKFWILNTETDLWEQKEEDVKCAQKNDHYVAEAKIRKKYPGCKIVSVKYQ
jgi:hypothetical protein